MPSFEADVVLRALIEEEVYATVGPRYLGADACAAFAEKLGVSKFQLWGAICNLRDLGRIEEIRSPEGPGVVALIPTQRGQRYYERSARKQPYPREVRHRSGVTPARPEKVSV